MKISTPIFIRSILVVLIAIVSCNTVTSATDSIYRDGIVSFSEYASGQYLEEIQYYEDTSRQLTIDNIVDTVFTKGKSGVQNMGVSASVFWFKIILRNDSDRDVLVFTIDNPLLNSVTLYKKEINDSLNHFTTDEVTKYKPFYARENLNTLPEFHVEQEVGTIAVYYFRVESFTQLLVPIKILTRTEARNFESYLNLFYGLYFGIMLVMFFYNLFVFLSIRDNSYLYYILYVLSVALVQLNVTGVGFKYIWPNYPDFERYAVFIFPTLTAFASILFVNNFLNINLYAPRTRVFFVVIIFAYLVTVVVSYLNQYIGYELINATALPLALLMFGVAAYIYAKHRYRPAAFFLIAWTAFLSSIIVFVLKDYGILPYNNLTVHAILIGSGLEVILLSFALADRINILEAQNRASREKILLATQENARIISEQNVILEERVAERTHELLRSNKDLQKALDDLKEAQTQLVEQEKMASLGQLTAGIAHEINNPINFVTSNVTPLKRDITILQTLLASVEELATVDIPDEEKLRKIEALKQEADYDYLNTEIDFLLKGIHEGAARTSEIVRGLRLFSRLDEDDVKLADVREGLDSTVAIVNHLLNGKIVIEKQYDEIPLVECFPGKLNQVFLNIMTNGIHAIDERWGHEKGGKLTIGVSADTDYVYIRIADNGIGMTKKTRKKLFEPFYTTKDVGVGTGLGLSIAWNTIRKHNGIIHVESTVGEGTEVILTIPIHHEPPKTE